MLIGGLLPLMNYNHPYSEALRQYYITTPVIPQVRGRVVEVPVKANEPVQEGDVLYRIDPEPYELKVASLEARLKEAEKDLERAKDLYAQQAVSERARDSAIADVDDRRARLDEARFNLEQTTVDAPDDGYVTQLALRPGMRALPFAQNPVMTFIHGDERFFIAWFRQNYLQRLKPGDAAEVIFEGIPGRIFDARLRQLIPAVAEGQVQPGSNLMSFSSVRAPGRIAVVLGIDDPNFQRYIGQRPAGVFGQAAIYSDHFHHVAIMRKVLLRMAGRMNYTQPIRNFERQ